MSKYDPIATKLPKESLIQYLKKILWNKFIEIPAIDNSIILTFCHMHIFVAILGPKLVNISKGTPQRLKTKYTNVETYQYSKSKKDF